MSAIVAQFPTNLTRARFLAAVTVLLVVLAFGASTGILYGQLADTRATLASSQTELTSTQSDLASSRIELTSTQTNLASTTDALASSQSTLAATQADRAAFSAQVDALNANVAQLTAERDGVRTQLAQVQADLQTARSNLNTASAERDRAQSVSQDLAQVSLLMADIVKASDDYNQVVQLQLSDLNSAVSAAGRYDWVGARVYVAQYNSRLTLQTQKATAVDNSVTKLQNWLASHNYI
jgi:chromosome segregation ATPase